MEQLSSLPLLPCFPDEKRGSGVGAHLQACAGGGEDPSRSLSMHHVRLNRMQLWTFPSQRDNEVSSGVENEAVVCPGGPVEAG